MAYNAYVQRACGKAEVDVRLASTALPRGAFFLVSETNGRPIEPVLQFFRDTCLAIPKGRSRRLLPKSYEAMAYDMKDFVDAMDAYDVELMEATALHLDRYVDSMVWENSPVTGEPYADRTVKRRLYAVRSFYLWAQERGLTKHKIDLAEIRPRSQDEQEEREEGEVWEPDAIDADRDVTAIAPSDLAEIMQALGPCEICDGQQPSRKGHPGSTRERLKFNCCLQVGLRREEVVRLRVSKLLKAVQQVKEPFDRYPLRVFGKGWKWRNVMAPGWLLLALANYIKGERAPIIAKRSTLDPDFRDHDRIFVRTTGGSSSLGNALNPRSMNASFAKTVRAIGLLRTTSSGRVLPKYRVHQLRHTYAVLEYFARKAIGDPEPWLYIQRQLGHESVETTRAIYLRVVHYMEAQVGPLLSEMLRRNVFGYEP